MKLFNKNKGIRGGLIGLLSAVAMLGATTAPVLAFDELIELKLNVIECLGVLFFDNENHEAQCGSGGPDGGLSWGNSGSGIEHDYSCSEGYIWSASLGCVEDAPTTTEG